MPDPAVFTINDLMARWKCNRKTVLAAIHSGKLAAFRVGERIWRVRADEVERFEHAPPPPERATPAPVPDWDPPRRRRPQRH